MDESKQTGRTFWDFLQGLISSGPRALIVILALCVLLLGGLGVIVAFVHSAAEPGTDVSVLHGLLQYKKARVPERPPLPQIRDTDTSAYILPQHIYFEENAPVVLLDRTLSLTRMPNGRTRLAGANVPNIRVAVRDTSGSSLRPSIDPQQLTFEVLTERQPFFELEYKGNYFSIAVESAGELPGYDLTARKLVAPSMDLKRFDEYSIYTRP